MVFAQPIARCDGRGDDEVRTHVERVMYRCTKLAVFLTLCAVTSVVVLSWSFLNDNGHDPYLSVLDVDTLPPTHRHHGEAKLFDLDFEYVENCAPCRADVSYLAVIVVTSHFGNVEARSAMRRSFSNDELERMRIRRIFLLGTSPGDGEFTTRDALRDESSRFGDILQGNFREDYRNLTYKHVMGLRWAGKHCSGAKLVVKMDDDIVVDVRRTIDLLKSFKFPSPNYIAGYILKGMEPKRDPANKWYTTLKEYGHYKYPTFVSGWFYVTTPKLAAKLADVSFKVPYFWIDDVYVTGMLAQKLKVRFLNINRYFAVHAELMQCCLRDLPVVQCDYLVGPNGGDTGMFHNFNVLAEKCYGKPCGIRERPLNYTCVVEKKPTLGPGRAIVEPFNLS